MLDEIAVTNLGVIGTARLEPSPGLVVVTGETGTGKTLLLGAVRLLLGETASRDLVGPHGDESRVEGRFVDDAGETVAARRVTAAGRSKAYLDGSMVPARTLRAKLSTRVELVAQHDALSLRRSGGLLDLVDAKLGRAGQGARADYAEAWAALGELRARQEAIGGDHRALRRELEMLEFQIGEIDAAGFAAGDDADLTAAAQRLRNAAAIIEGMEEARAAIDALVMDGLGSASDALHRAGRHDSHLAELAGELDTVISHVGELSGEIVRSAEQLDADPRALADVEAKIARLSDLRRKYGENLDAVLRFRDEAQARALELTELLDAAAGLEGDLDKAGTRVAEAGNRLRTERRRAAGKIGHGAEEHLRDLGFRSPVVEIGLEPTDPGPRGADRVTGRFASDESLTPGPVGSVASGGELTRLVLALRLAAGITDAPTVVFDEIDAGIGGATALAMGEKLAALARERQVLCVTHLPQVAAFGNTHYIVERDGNAASVRLVEGPDRLEELARMLAGLPDSERGREHAAELLARAGRS